MVPYQLNLRLTPTILSRIVAGIPPERWRESSGEGRYSLLGIVCHLADTERTFLGRMREAIRRDVPEFGPPETADPAHERGYAARELARELEGFAATRAETVAFVESLTETQLDREFVQPFGRMSLRDFVIVLTGHDLYHLEQASAYLSDVF